MTWLFRPCSVALNLAADRAGFEIKGSWPPPGYRRRSAPKERFMRYVIFLLALTCGSVHGDDWSPPENPNPQAILQEAHADTRAKRYETALAKHVWFHEKALSIEPALYGVRLSFALSNWHELAKEYPPALMKLKDIRDQAKKNVIEGKDVRESFHDMGSINDQLGEQAATKKVFVILDEKSPKIAKEVFDLAKPSLVQAKAYSLFGKYIVPEDDFSKMRETYRQGKELAEDARFGVRHLDFANKKFANDATTLVAILAVNDRKEEAEEIAASARAEWDDRSFHAGLEKALMGVVPDPWP
jgi:hypothetical protein